MRHAGKFMKKLFGFHKTLNNVGLFDDCVKVSTEKK